MSEAVISKEVAFKTQHALDALKDAEAVCGGEAFGEARGVLQQGPCAKKSAFKAFAKIAHLQNEGIHGEEKGLALKNAQRALRDVFVVHCIAREDPENIAGFLETVKEVLDGARLMGWDPDLKAQLALSFHKCVGYVTSIHATLKWRTNLHSCWPHTR